MSSSDAVVEVKEAMTNLDLKEKAKVETGSDTDAVKVVLEKAMPQDEKAPEEKKPELNISGENSENMNPSEASKKNKKKKKKPAPATAEEIGKKVDVVEKKEDVKEVLGEIGDNGGENATEVEMGCSYCKKPNPAKRCSKRHPKCLKKMFCNETCESLAHEDKKAAAVKKQAASKAAAAKKATKVKNWKNTDSGQFWWHDQ